MLGHAIVTLLDSESTRQRMGAAGRERALARFDARETTAALLDVIIEARTRFRRSVSSPGPRGAGELVGQARPVVLRAHAEARDRGRSVVGSARPKVNVHAAR